MRSRSIAWAVFGVLLSCSAQAQPAPPQDALDEDGLGWPKEIAAGESQITVYQPQLEFLKGEQMGARMAVSVSPPGGGAPVFGSVWIRARLLTDRDRRTATPVEVQVTDTRFPHAEAGREEEIRRSISTELPRWRLTFSMDHLLSELALIEHQKATARGLKNDPPTILYRAHPAVLVTVQGEPAWRDLAGSPYQRISNSAFFMLKDPSSGSFLLHIPPYWWTSAVALGPWKELSPAPVAAEAAWKAEAKPELPTPEEASTTPPERPEVLVATRPTELVWTRGPSQFVPIQGTELLYVKNTESDLFLDIQSQDYFVLLSGRWYRGPGGSGPWAYVAPEQLPDDFRRIPLGSEKQHVLASVPGTPQARDAVLDAAIPQTAAVSRSQPADLGVTYDGDPQFVDIENSPVRYAVNTPYSVFWTGGRYYCCQDGIWYDSDLGLGPWAVCVGVPDQIYLIPPSCPHYYCTYCHVFGVTPDVAYVGYYPGYRGCYVAGSTVVYGTGWDYPCWTGAVWYPRPVTWGCGVRYNVTTGNWRFRLGMGGPCAWMGLSYHSGWAGHSVSVGVGGWWGGVGYRHTAVDVHQNLNFVTHVDRRTTFNVYARRPERLAPIHRELPRAVPRLPAERRAPNNVYVDRQGSSFRRGQEGAWEQHTRQGWQREAPAAPHEMPRFEARHQELEQRSRARDYGMERTRSFHQNSSPRPSYSAGPRGRH